MAEDYGHDNLGENPHHFNFSIIDYSVMAGRQALKLGLQVRKSLMNLKQVFKSICSPRRLGTRGKRCYKWMDLVHRPPCLFTMMPWVM